MNQESVRYLGFLCSIMEKGEQGSTSEEGKKWTLGTEHSACDVVTLETSDSAYRRLHLGEDVEVIGIRNFNRVTGPIAVTGAEPGDALRVNIIDIEIIRAWTVWLQGFGLLGGLAEETKVVEIKIEDDPDAQVSSSNKKPKRGWISDRLAVPIRPMIGCIGVAPKQKTASTLAPVYNIGGNMDLRELEAGTTIYLPVEVAGGLLSIGDIHAAMGAGEPTSVAFEASAFVTVRVSVVKNMHLECPRLRVGNDIILVCSDERQLEKARKLAIQRTWTMLTQEYHLTPLEAYAYTSSSLSLRFGGPASCIVLAVIPEPSFKTAK